MMSANMDNLAESQICAQSQKLMRQQNPSSSTADRFYQRDLVLRHIMRACSLPDHDRLGRIAQGLGQILGWRWVGISQIDRNQRRAEVLAWWKNRSLDRIFHYALAGSPCQVAVTSRDYCLYTNVQKDFPDWGLNDVLTARLYCAMPVLLGERVIGHVFALHDEESVDVDLMEDTLRIVARFLGGLMAEKPTAALDKAELREASLRRDGLTGLAGLDSLQNDIISVSTAFQEYLLSDSLLVLASLQGLNIGRETLAENNALIAWFAARLNQLSRPMDRVYRIGEHQFAWLVPNAGCGQSAWLIDELQSLRLILDKKQSQPIELQIGHACLTEITHKTEASRAGILQLAAQRLDRHINAQTKPVCRTSWYKRFSLALKRYSWPRRMCFKHCY